MGTWTFSPLTTRFIRHIGRDFCSLSRVAFKAAVGRRVAFSSCLYFCKERAKNDICQ